MADAERGDDGVERDARLMPRREPAPEQQIPPDAEVRKQLRILEHEADAPPVFGHEDAGFGVDEDPIVEHDAAAIGTQEAGDQIDRHRFAGPGAAEQSRDADVVLEGDFEIEGPELERDIDADHAKVARRLLTPRCTSSDVISAVSAIAMAMMVSCQAAASPFGICV